MKQETSNGSPIKQNKTKIMNNHKVKVKVTSPSTEEVKQTKEYKSFRKKVMSMIKVEKTTEDIQG